MKIISIITIILTMLLTTTVFARPVVGYPGVRNTVVNPVVDDVRPGIQSPAGLSVEERRIWDANHPNAINNNVIERRNAVVEDLQN